MFSEVRLTQFGNGERSDERDGPSPNQLVQGIEGGGGGFHHPETTRC